ncbi:MAG: hypothetical protein IJX04_03865 [Oscillospiraceae bacterium]|nr:hypothetical protein [Oscillospiraceae bacterium]
MKGFLSLLPVQRLRVQVKIGGKLVALTLPSPYPSACRGCNKKRMIRTILMRRSSLPAHPVFYKEALATNASVWWTKSRKL